MKTLPNLHEPYTACRGLLAIVLLTFIASTAVAGKLVGGQSETQPADDKVEGIAKKVQSAITQRVEADNYAVTQYTAISYRTQLVNGINYFIKIRVNDDPSTGYVHARVFQSFGGNSELVGLETGHSLEDPIGFVETFL
ncbi:hypothetical protein BV898_14169 [Hypsibius exemplaris]|uniref:Cystatin domain-containing protein n=1 Tax=Hypsibius exemplaris TaxID=2072580 RepID=A0A1W0W8J7_HYPEX|nr:hypothetical protein BV898_14169 [Hypsibius exemplaris]